MQEYLTIEFFIISAFGGLFGTYLMDIIGKYLHKKNISSGGTSEFVGRWFLHILKGTFKHKNIEDSVSFPNERIIGMFFHYVIAGIGIAMLYPLFFILIHSQMNDSNLTISIVFGLLTSVFPWLWMMPSFGWGIGGLKREPSANTVIAPIITHFTYGLGLGLTLFVYSHIALN